MKITRILTKITRILTKIARIVTKITRILTKITRILTKNAKTSKDSKIKLHTNFLFIPAFNEPTITNNYKTTFPFLH